MIALILDKLLIKYASPTLGGIKTGSLFKVYKNSSIDLKKEIDYYNLSLNYLDLYLEILYSCDKYDLIYIYNFKMLTQELNNKEVKEFFKIFNYRCDFIDEYISCLKKRFNILKKTPHEIGIFLGYPLNDVKSFIIYKGKNFKISGCWKVYDNVDYCIKQFNKFKKYRYMFYYLYENNYNIESLVLMSKNMSSYIK